jgi:ADP-heptose:LPS heptosyltransferase
VTPEKEHILVIRLGALGDLVFCFQSFHEIRQAHPNAKIALLTRAPFAAFAKSLPWFDHIIIDTHPTFAAPLGWARLRREVLDFSPDRIYDLQGKRRQTILYALLGGPFGPAWSGAAPFCKFPRPKLSKSSDSRFAEKLSRFSAKRSRTGPPTQGMSFADFMAAQLRAAGVPALPAPDLAFLDANVEKFALPARYVVLIPGSSPDAPHKRWSARKFAELARKLGMPCIVVGTNADAEAVGSIKVFAPEIVDLCGKTSLFELAGILRRAALVVGNDTGPLHMAAVLRAPTIALFSGKSSPVWSKPPGSKVVVKQSQNLADLGVDEVVAAIKGLGGCVFS